MFRKTKLSFFVIIISLINLVFFQYPFFKFVISNVEINNANGILLLVSLFICTIIANAMVFFLFLYLLKKVGKWIIAITFIINSICLYFINTYGVIIDQSMIGNVFNTKYTEASSFFSITFVWYLVFLGILPTIYILKTPLEYLKFKRFISYLSITIIFLLSIAYINAPNWLWIDKNSKTLGALVMPWSYLVNTGIYIKNKNKENQKQILLPDAKIKDNKKSVVVLVIGESARSANFSLYGYNRETNPKLSKIENLNIYNAKSSATYTTAGVKAILEYKDTSDLYEILPNYLYRNNVDVIWRTSNWGEPTVKIEKYEKTQDLIGDCKRKDCDYDGVLISDLKNEVSNSNKDKILIIIHTSTSHGPTYYKKYPKEFNKFVPVCTSVELSKCTQQELINAYDNTILYTDYLLSDIINQLKNLQGYSSSMIYVSDHGESLGEKNLYMHGIPMTIAPKEQYEIPFIAWSSDESISFKQETEIGQHHIFHSILDLLSVDSPIYNEEFSIISKK